jgi:threonine dehydrogenase-like Zn-dependent dehydrogenase
MGAAKVIAIDHYPRRLELARSRGAEVIDFKTANVREVLLEMSGGIGVDAVIDAVGMEAHGFAIDNLIDRAKQTLTYGFDRASALKQALLAVRVGGKVSVPGVYGGFSDKFPLGALMEKGIQLRSGQTHVQKYTRTLLQKIDAGELDTTFLISHRLPLEQAAHGYKCFHDSQDTWTKVVLRP